MTKKSDLKLLDTLAKDTGVQVMTVSWAKWSCYLANAMFIISTSLYLFASNKGLPILQYLWRPLQWQKFNSADSAQVNGGFESYLAVPVGVNGWRISLVPVLVLLVVAVDVLLLARAYLNVDLKLRRRFLALVKQQQQSSASSSQVTVKTASLNYAFFYVNALFTVIFLALSSGVLVEAPLLVNFIASTGVSSALAALLTRSSSHK